jgi:hypothetical protein
MEVNDYRFYTLALPDDLTLWTVPGGAFRRWDDSFLVYDVLVESGLVLRHYSFYDRWFVVNVTLDTDGRFVPEPGPIDWCFNIDLCTPLFTVGHDGYDVDLCLDLLVAPDGRDYRLVDEDEFDHAMRNGWITSAEADGARNGVEELRGIIEGGRLVSFLEGICPFEVKPIQQPPPQKPNLTDYPLLHRDRRHRYFGKKLEARRP